VLEILLGEVETGTPAWLEPLGKCIDRLRACKSLKELLEGKLLADGRKIKVGANGRYFTPAVLIAFTRYNFIARRTFFRLVRAELEGLRADLARLEKAGVTVVDCRAAKLGERESVATMKSMVTAWKQPFRAEYAEGMSFEQLVAVRQAVQSAAGTPAAKPVVKAVAAVASRIVNGSAPVRVEQTVRPPATPAQSAAAAPKPAPAKQFNVEDEFRAIQAQLTEGLLHGASAENTMTRLTLGKQRLVLSSWEVRGFVEPNEEFSSAMQNGVATRVLVERELESAKANGRREHLPALVKFAQTQAAMMQEHVAQARDARDIDAAVTLAATSKRLTQLLQEAQKFAVEGRQ
jgi:hypothetical protein